jgi:CubicO group peptidase (beta-lactamase class C family)
MGKFIHAATTSKIATNNRWLGEGYGYQIWTSCGGPFDFCFVGYGGQFLYFNKSKDIVIYQHAAMESQSVFIAPRITFGRAIKSLPE